MQGRHESQLSRRGSWEIDPLVRDKYYEWVRYSRRWRSRKILPIGALQKYYESRKAAFVAEGGTPDQFDDASTSSIWLKPLTAL